MTSGADRGGGQVDRIHLCGLALVLVALIAFADAQPAWASDSQLWTTVAASVKLSPQWSLSQDLTTRFSKDEHGLVEIRASTMVGYHLKNGITLGAGYTHAPNYSDGHVTAMERRAREQVAFDDFARLGPGELSGRLRFEQRWREGAEGTGWRLRPFIRYTVPFRPGGQTALTVTEEPFVDLNTNSFQTVRGLERFRTLVAIRTPLTRDLGLEAGYLNQHVIVPHGRDANDNVASISLSWNG